MAFVVHAAKPAARIEAKPEERVFEQTLAHLDFWRKSVAGPDMEDFAANGQRLARKSSFSVPPHLNGGDFSVRARRLPGLTFAECLGLDFDEVAASP